jgi:hypothetical protein
MANASFDKFAYHKTMGAGLTDGEYRVLAVMWDYASADGTNIRPTHKAVAAQCGTSERSVRRHVASLLAKEWLHENRPGRSAGRGGGAAEYRLKTPGTPANPDRCSVSDVARTPANPGQNTGQSVQEHQPILTETPAKSGRPSDQEQIKRTDQRPDSSVSGEFASNSPGAATADPVQAPKGYGCCECGKRFDGDPPQRHLLTKRPVCADCCPF